MSEEVRQVVHLPRMTKFVYSPRFGDYLARVFMKFPWRKLPRTQIAVLVPASVAHTPEAGDDAQRAYQEGRDTLVARLIAECPERKAEIENAVPKRLSRRTIESLPYFSDKKKEAPDGG